MYQDLTKLWKSCPEYGGPFSIIILSGQPNSDAQLLILLLTGVGISSMNWYFEYLSVGTADKY